MPREDMLSSKGATGEMQIIPKMAADPGYGAPTIFDIGETMGFDTQKRDEATARALANDPAVAREYAKQYLGAMYNRFGSVDEAAAAYNLGPGGLLRADSKFERLPEETRGYVSDVRRFYQEDTGEPYGITIAPRPRSRPKGLLQ
jgi:soluble lytic murein transglycosylase-like protein